MKSHRQTVFLVHDQRHNIYRVGPKGGRGVPRHQTSRFSLPKLHKHKQKQKQKIILSIMCDALLLVVPKYVWFEHL